MDYQAAPLILNPTKSGSRASVYIAPDSLYTESNLGLLFIIVEITSREKSTKRLIEQIIDDLSQEYYQSATSDIEIALETTCQKFNENILTSTGKDKKWFSKLNILIVAAKDKELVLSNFGNMSTILFRHNKTINILDPSPDDDKSPKQTKTFKVFSQLTSGEIKENDIIVFTNPFLLDYFSHEKIKKTCQTFPPKKAAETLATLLIGNLTPTAFGSAILKIDSQAGTEAQTISQLQEGLTDLYGPQTSMDQLSSLERKTGRLMTASLWPNIKRLADKIIFGLKKLFSKKKSHLKLPKNQAKPAPAPREFIKLSFFHNALKSLAATPKQLAARISQLAKFKPKTTKKADTKPKKISPPKSLYTPRKLSVTGRIYLTIVIILVAAFVVSTLVISRSKANRKTLANFDQQIEFIQEKANAAEAALIYQDEDKARRLLDEARSTLTQIANSGNKTVIKNSRKIELTYQSLESVTLKIYHLTKLDGLETLTDFATLPDKPFDFQLNDFALFEENIYVLDNQNTLYKVEPQTSSFTPITTLEQDQDLSKLAFFNDEIIIIQDQANQFINFNLTQKNTTQLNVALKGETKINSWQIYSNNLYLIDYLDNQIFKFPKSADNFSPRSTWLKDPNITLTPNSELVIDGNIWVNTDSQIVKLFKGLKQNFELTGLEKELGSETKIYTNSDTNYLFILDQQNYKIIVIDKSTGQVKQQFLYPDRYQLSAISSSPNGKTIYLLGKEKVFKLVL